MYFLNYYYFLNTQVENTVFGLGLTQELIYCKPFEAIYKDFITYSTDLRRQNNLNYPPMTAHTAALSYENIDYLEKKRNDKAETTLPFPPHPVLLIKY